MKISIKEIEKWIIDDEKLEELNKKETEFRRNNPDYSKEILYNEKFNRYESFIDVLKDVYINGNINDGIINYGLKPYYFRGQIYDYGICNSSLNRKLIKSFSPEIELFKFFMKESQLYIELSQLKEIKDWINLTGYDIFPVVFAQHFGMETDIIDITNKLSVAMFFATCVHIGKNRFRPLNKKDIENHKNGVLYIAQNEYIKEILKLNNLILKNNVNVNYIKTDKFPQNLCDIQPIGFLPYTRCHKQRGHFVCDNLSKDYDLIKNGFIKTIFEHSIDFSEKIFDKFNGGKDIFDYEGSEGIQKLIDAIKCSKKFSKESFIKGYENYIKYSTKKLDKNIILEKLTEEKIEIIKNYKILLNTLSLYKKWNLNAFIKKEGIFPGRRKIIFK